MPWSAPRRRASWSRRTWPTTSPSPRSRTGSASSPSTPSAASHEAGGAPRADRSRGARGGNLPRPDPRGYAVDGEQGREAGARSVDGAGRGRGAVAGAGNRVGPGCVRAVGQAGGAVGTAGATLVGVFALSALGILTVGWHPLVLLRTRETGDEKRETGGAKRETGSGKREAPRPDDAGRERKIAALREAKARTAKLTPPVSRFPSPAREGALIPPLDLLTPAAAEDADAGVAQIDLMGHKLIETLQTFRVEGSIAGRTVGPVVTQYEVAPGPGVKVGRIAALADDLALAMRAPSLRIVAPIPGKAAVGIEVPNPMPRMVHVRELIEGADYQRSTRALPIALGKNLEGDPVVADLAKMPHLLIAGVTGSGKSVCINTIITSLIYTHPPEKLKLLMIDPKMV